MKRTWLLFAVVALGTLPVLAGGRIEPRAIEPAFTVQAAEGEDGAPEYPRAKNAITEFLALDEDQVAQWDALWAAREAAVEPLREQLRSTEEQLKELLGSENPDPAAVGTLVISGKTLRDGIVAAHQSYVEGFEALLTVEQRAKLGAVRRAARLAPVVPAFAVFGLVVPPGR